MPKISILEIARPLAALLISLAAGCSPTAVQITSEPNAFYVAPSGDDTNPGSLEKPFKTIQKCADVVTAGFTCVVRAGTYRETVTPKNSGTSAKPITFKTAPGETALVSGADVVTGWTPGAGAIQTAGVNWDLGAGNNQVFVNGKMVFEARYPNAVSGDLLESRNWGRVRDPQGAKSAWTFAADGVPANLTGAKINIVPGPVWVAETGAVTASSGGTLSFSALGGQLEEVPSFDPNLYALKNGNPYFVWGKRELLDAPGEWFLEGGTLSIIPPEGVILSGATVEIKRRLSAFDLRDRSFITLKGFQVKAATITTADPARPNEATSSNIVLDDVHVRYPSHFTLSKLGNAWGTGVNDSGVLLFGRNHTLKNSTVAFSAGNGVTMNGVGHVLENNIIHDVNYAATDSSAVSTDGSGLGLSNQTIRFNTLYNAGRSVLVHRNAQRLKILNNHLYNAGLLVNDLGMTYTFQSDGGGTEIAYNLVHDNFAPSESMGIYLDNGSKNFLVHHNIVYNVRAALNLNLPSLNNRVYNNTLLGWNEASSSWGPNQSDWKVDGTELSNNIFTGPRNISPDGARAILSFAGSNNLEAATNPKFTNLSEFDFSLQSGSSAIDAGKVIAGITDGFVGAAPDIGALESGKPMFRTGANITEPCVIGDDCAPATARSYGLKAEYFSDETLTNLAWSRIDPNLDQGWYETTGPSGTFLPKNEHWSARWTGYLEVPVSGAYTFRLTADDGVRLWIAGQPVVDRWTFKDPPIDEATLTLTAGRRVPVKLEFRQGSGGATVRLEWAFPGQPSEVVPRRFFSVNP
jgi:PA14 domain/Right handed beta helix region